MNFFLSLCSLIPLILVSVYVSHHVYTVPINDQWNSVTDDPSSVDIAIKTANNSLTFYDLYEQHTNHRIVTGKLLTALAVVVAQWDLRFEAAATLGLITLNLILVGTLFASHNTRLAAGMLVVFSALLFSIRQTYILVQGFMSVWPFVEFFFIAAVWVLYRFAVGWRALAVSSILAVCATFSLATGLTVWPALFVGLWLRGYRKASHYIYWIIIALLAVFLYFADYRAENNTEVGSYSLAERATFVMVNLGTAFVSEDITPVNYGPGMTMGFIGLALFAANAFYLWRSRHHLTRYGAWITLSIYAIGASGLISLGRANDLSKALLFQYTVNSIVFWIGTISLTVLNSWHLWQQKGLRWPQEILMRANLVALAALVLAYIPANLASYGQVRRNMPAYETCLMNYPIDLNERCFWGAGRIARPDVPPEDHYQRVTQLAIHRLNVFADMPEASALRDYQPDSPLIIDAPRAWQHYHILDRVPEAVPVDPANVLHLLSAGQPDHVVDVLGPQTQFTETENIQERQTAVQEFVGDAEQIWYLSAEENPEVQQYLDAQMGIVQHHPPYENPRLPFSITEYRPFTPLYYFGEMISLQSWALQDSVEVEACQEVRLLSQWSAQAPPPEIYSMTLVLTDEQGVGVARQDGNPSAVLTRQWQPGWIYEDERTLIIPCEIEPGAYPLLIGLYDFETLEALPVTTTDGALLGDQLYLTTLNVQ